MSCWASFPAGREGRGWGPQVWPLYLQDLARGKGTQGPRDPGPPAPIQMAGGRCTVQLFPALALPDQGINTPTTHLAAGASEAKKRGTCRPPSFLPLTPLSVPTGPSSVAHQPRPTLSRLSLIAIGFSACL